MKKAIVTVTDRSTILWVDETVLCRGTFQVNEKQKIKDCLYKTAFPCSERGIGKINHTFACGIIWRCPLLKDKKSGPISTDPFPPLWCHLRGLFTLLREEDGRDHHVQVSYRFPWGVRSTNEGSVFGD